MTSANDHPKSNKTRAFWLRRELWSGIVVAATVILFLSDNQGFLKRVAAIDHAVAKTIAVVTPGALEGDFAKRGSSCEYHWLVVCEEPRPKTLCFSFDPTCAHGDSWANLWRGDTDGVEAPGLLMPLWDTMRAIGALPDMTWYGLAVRYEAGWIPFGFLLVFIALNCIFALRAPPITWPITLPLCAAFASVAFWIIQQFFLLAANSVGALIEVFLFIACIPHIIVLALSWIRSGSEVEDVVHKARDVAVLTTNRVKAGQD